MFSVAKMSPTKEIKYSKKKSTVPGPKAKSYNLKFSLPNNTKLSHENSSIESSCYIIDESNSRIQMDKIFQRKNNKLNHPKKPKKMQSMDNQKVFNQPNMHSGVMEDDEILESFSPLQLENKLMPLMKK